MGGRLDAFYKVFIWLNRDVNGIIMGRVWKSNPKVEIEHVKPTFLGRYYGRNSGNSNGNGQWLFLGFSVRLTQGVALHHWNPWSGSPPKRIAKHSSMAYPFKSGAWAGGDGSRNTFQWQTLNTYKWTVGIPNPFPPIFHTPLSPLNHCLV